MSLYAMPGFLPLLQSTTTGIGPNSDSTSAGRTTHSQMLQTWDIDAPVDEKECSSNFHHSGNLISIMIKESRINPARLIDCLTSPGSSRKRLNGKMSGSKGDNSRRVGVVRSAQKQTSHSIPTESSKCSDLHAGKMILTPQEEAMEFDLAVYCSKTEKSYSVTRNLASVVSLRHDIVQELERRNTHRCMQVSSSARSICIPQVPRILNSYSLNGLNGSIRGSLGGGFSFLQALLQSYVPHVEDWLRSVVKQLQLSCLEDCLTLYHFLLWDENSSRNTATAPVLFRESSFSSSSSVISPSLSASSFRQSLDSIEESDEREM